MIRFLTASILSVLILLLSSLPIRDVQSSSTFCFCQATPIWLHPAPPADHEVALFRTILELPTPKQDITIALFADTRYEAYVNGTLIGRGPARFSPQRHEYDLLSIGDLPAGQHTLTVRVQWAPSKRRSESERPFLWAVVQSQAQTLTATGPHWQAAPLAAYQSNSAPVHRWGLIGPTEIVDLSLLSPNWKTGNLETAWQPVVPVNVQPESFFPRSIPQLEELVIPARVIGRGWLAPGFTPLELPGMVDQFTIPLQALRQTMVSLISIDDPLTSAITIDGQPLSWTPAPNRPPGIVTTSYPLMAGAHSLQVSGLQNYPEGWTILISSDGLDSLPAPGLSAHAGRRMLLSAPQPGQRAVNVISISSSLTLQFQAPASYVILDLGRTVHGRLTAEVNGPDGSIVDIGWDERLWNNAIPLPYPGQLHPEWNQVDSWLLDGRTHQITTIDTRAGRYILIAVRAPGPVELRLIQINEERYPVIRRGSFTSSDPLLDQIWQVSIDTLLPNMTDSYTDTPWRERGQWWGDVFVADHINQVAFGDYALLRRGLRQLADHFASDGTPAAIAPNTGAHRMLDYGMLWAQSLASELRRSGDPALARELWPTLVRFLDHLATYRRSDTGLLDIPVGPWALTNYLDSSVVSARYGQSTPVNAMYYGTLRAAATIATTLNEHAQASRWNSEAETLRDRINAHLYDQTARRYHTTIIDGQIIAPGPHAQAMALAYDLTPASEVQPIADALIGLITRQPERANLQLYGIFWALEGFRKAGRIEDAIDLIKHFYGWQLNQGATTWWEHLSANQRWTASLSHSWAGSPAWFLTTAILGVYQTGSNSWEIEPAWQGVRFVQGTFPLPTGDLVVSWEQPQCETQRVSISAPAGTQGYLLLPPPTESTVITINERLVWNALMRDPIASQLADGRLQLLLYGGSEYTIEQQRVCLSTWLPFVGH